MIGFGAFLTLALCTPRIARKVQVWKLTRDMTGGTSLVYEIDTKGLIEEQKKDLSKKMIAVLKKRVDPYGYLPIVWQPLSETRFEIQISPALESPAVRDIQRMLKGAGILEFRILPTQGHPEVDMDQIAGYVEKLKEMGPKAVSDTQYVWCEIENIEEWRAADREGRPSITETFGDKPYVLASNKVDESMLHSPGQKDWKLEKSYPTTDSMGRRAIGFLLDDRGGNKFFKVTGKNLDRPLCILLDGIAISAPNIESSIRRQASITGNFTQTEAEDMVNKLNAGCLPAKLIEQPIEVKTIGLNKKSK
jgi:preprotein translocase subunit SecD